MFDLLCVTNRLICEGDFLEKIRQLTACGLSGVILREKDLEEVRYRALATQVMETCGQSRRAVHTAQLSSCCSGARSTGASADAGAP